MKVFFISAKNICKTNLVSCQKIQAHMSKRMKHLFTILIAGICLVSCSSNGDDPENGTDPLVKQMKYEGAYLEQTPVNSSEINFNFEYDNSSRLTKKVGGYVDLSSSTGFGKFFTNEIYTSLIYTNNKVTVENFDTSDIYNVAKNSIYYTLNSSNLIEEKEIPNSLVVTSRKLIYKYSNGKLVEIVTTYPNMVYYPDDETDYVLTYSEKFYYDANDNLIKTEYFEQHNGKDEGRKVVRTFEDYDASYNPFKRLQLLEEYFYRSLSKNNFRKYTETTYYYGDVSKNETAWTFTYDAQGNIILN